MTEPKTKSEGPLSAGAKAYVRELVAQELFGVDFEFSSKYTEKGLLVEEDSIQLLNRVRGLSLTKNTERRTNDWITGECDLFDAPRREGHDIKSSWSFATFPITVADCEDRLYEWQCRGYMALWDADQWSVDYALVSTPERLIGYEPLPLHIVDHIPEHHRLTTWLVKRDAEKEAAIWVKVEQARTYYEEVIAEFDRSHPETFAEMAALVQKSDHDRINDEGAARLLAEIPSTVVPMPTRAPAAPVSAPSVKLGHINQRLAPLAVDAATLAALGFPHSATEGAAKLWHEHQFGPICSALIAHIAKCRDQRQAA